MASGFCLSWNDVRPSHPKFVGTAVGESTFSSLFQQRDRTAADNAQRDRARRDDSCFPQLRSNVGATLPRRDPRSCSWDSPLVAWNCSVAGAIYGAVVVFHICLLSSVRWICPLRRREILWGLFEGLSFKLISTQPLLRVP